MLNNVSKNIIYSDVRISETRFFAVMFKIKHDFPKIISLSGTFGSNPSINRCSIKYLVNAF